ncbi:MAG: hypothetical protein SV775_05885, partial [Thermodesulfobacteriota bacterium]|nr:hypothetical protein [Thermodesulfobacteriota bacterium]
MNKIKIAVVGIGNCASSLIQGIEYYHRRKKDEAAVGLMHYDLGGYKPQDISVVAAFDIDERKVGMDLAEAIFALPNCTTVFHKNIPLKGIKVRMGWLSTLVPQPSSHRGQHHRSLCYLDQALC